MGEKNENTRHAVDRGIKKISAARGSTARYKNKEINETGGGVVARERGRECGGNGLVAHRGARVVAASPRLAVWGQSVRLRGQRTS